MIRIWIRIQQQGESGYSKIPGPDPDSVNTATSYEWSESRLSAAQLSVNFPDADQL
jgi:hypothetical protein